MVHARKIALVFLLAACPGAHTAGDADRSGKHLDIAKDALAKGDLDQAQSEAEKAIAIWKGNDEAYNVAGLTHVVRAAGMTRILEVDDCMTGVDAEAMQNDRDDQLAQAIKLFGQAVDVSPDYGEAYS